MRHLDGRSIAEMLASPLAQELVRLPLCRLAYVGRDGYPRVVPIGFVWKRGRFVVCTAAGAPKVRELTANHRVALTIDTETEPPHVLLVRGTASIEMVDGVPDEYLEASRKGVPRERWTGFEKEVRGLYKQMARITIKPEWAKLIDFETVLPVAVEELIARGRL